MKCKNYKSMNYIQNKKKKIKILNQKAQTGLNFLKQAVKHKFSF